MQIRPENLERALQQGPHPVYLIAGDETLVVEEACDAIIANARRHGFAEREVVVGESNFDWHTLAEAAGNLSLFAARRIIDLRLPARLFDKAAGEAIGSYLDRASGDTLLLVRTGRLDAKQRKSGWLARVEEAGVVMLVWPLSAAEFRRWMAARCRKAGLDPDRDALEFLCVSTEGNLLAAAQEVDKLRLLDLPQPVSLDVVRAAVLDASHFDTFDLLDAALGVEPARVRRVLYVLREEGVAPLNVLGLLASWVRRMLTGSMGGVPPQRARLIESARRRLADADLEACLALATMVDRQVKGAAAGDPWQTLESLAMRLAGVRLGC